MENVDQLLALFDERDRMKNAYNDELATLLAPTAMTALFELFELEPEKVQWGAIDLVDETVVFIVTLTYTTSDDNAEFLQYMDAVANASPEAKVRSLRVGVPVKIAFADIDTIKEYLMSMVKTVAGVKDEPEVTPGMKKFIKELETPDTQTGFDVSNLTKEQLAQLLFFQQQAGETQ